MSNYLKKFQAMYKDLERYPFIKPLEFTPRRPITAAQLKAVETELGAPLDPAIRDFYKETNGLKVHWRIKRDLGVDEAKKLRKKSSDYSVKIAEFVGDPFAIINLIPIQESTVDREWNELTVGVRQKKIEFGGKAYSVEEFKTRLKPFDLLNREFCMAFRFPTGAGKPQILLLSEGYSEWDNSRLTDFESYLEMLLATRGIVEARVKIFGKERGDLEPPLLGGPDFWKKGFTPKLFT